MSIPPPWSQVLDFFGTPLGLEASPGQLSGDAGLLAVRKCDQRIGLTRAFAGALDDPLGPGLSEHTLMEMVRSRVYGLRAGHEDHNEHDTARANPVFRLLAGRWGGCAGGGASASWSAASRSWRSRTRISPDGADRRMLPGCGRKSI
jgi:hypothetical protein